MVNRILEILKYKNISASKFADEIGVQRSSISHIISERNKPSLELIQKILSKYPEISSEWLITGKKTMLDYDIDLFSQTNSNDSKNKEENKIIEEVTNVNSGKLHLNDTFMPEDDTFVNNSKSNIGGKITESINNVNDSKSKTIEKIVFFYSDKTFKEYISE